MDEYKYGNPMMFFPVPLEQRTPTPRPDQATQPDQATPPRRRPPPASPLLAPVQQTIKEYFEIYCQINLDRLCEKWSKKNAFTTIMGCVDEPHKIQNTLDAISDPELKVISKVLFKLLTGRLEKTEPLMESLMRVDTTAALEELNKIIADEITRYTKQFFNGIRMSSPAVSLTPRPLVF